MSAGVSSPFVNFVTYGVGKTLRKAWVHLLAALPLTRSQPVVTSRYGIRMRANWRDRTFQYCRYATYGHALSDYIAAQDHAFTFVDIGANQGLYGLLAARNPHCVSVVAFEPVASTFALLRDNIALNDAAATVKPVQAAVSLHSSMARIATDAAHSGIASLRDTATTEGEEIRILGIAGVDALLTGLTPLIVKVDVEGHEETVIEALLASEHRNRIVAIFYEVDTRWTNASLVQTRLRAAGFARFERYGIGRHYDILATR